MVRVVVEELEQGPRLSPRTLSPDLEYRVQTVVVGVHDPLSGAESLVYFGPGHFIQEFGPDPTVT
jgi:hypothetical protein